jgi:hypothetical protein
MNLLICATEWKRNLTYYVVGDKAAVKTAALGQDKMYTLYM